MNQSTAAPIHPTSPADVQALGVGRRPYFTLGEEASGYVPRADAPLRSHDQSQMERA